MEVATKTYKFHLLPSAGQRLRLDQHLEACRFVYNCFLDRRTRRYERNEKQPSYYNDSADLTRLKEKLPWLCGVSDVVLRCELQRLNWAFFNFLEGDADLPKPYPAKAVSRSFCIPVSASSRVSVERGRISLPKFREGIRFRGPCNLEGGITFAVVHRDRDGQYFVRIRASQDGPKGWMAGEAHYIAAEERFVFDDEGNRLRVYSPALPSKRQVHHPVRPAKLEVTTKTYECRLLPTDDQRQRLDQQLEACRFVYNYFLERRARQYQQNEWQPSSRKKSSGFVGFLEKLSDLTLLKKERPWLDEASYESLSMELWRLASALSKFFAGKAGFPEQRPANDDEQGFLLRHGVSVKGNRIKLPKFCEGIELQQGCELGGRVRLANVYRDRAGQYFVRLHVVEAPSLSSNRQVHHAVQPANLDSRPKFDAGNG